MSKNLFGLGITALILSVAPVSGQQLGTVEQARAMLDRAIGGLKSNEAAALSEFNDQNNKQFHERDLYVFCYNMSDGKITVYESPALLNVDVRTLARALYLGSSLYRIHGSNEPWTIGTNVSSGCIRMRNEDVTDLYQRVKVGTKVVVI